MSDHTRSLADMRDGLRQLTAQGDWPALQEQARQDRDAFPDAWEPQFYESRALVERGRYEEADHLLLLAADRFPRNPRFPVLYGRSGARWLAPEDAIVRWRSVLMRTPNEPAVYTGLAQACTLAGQAEEADRVLAEGQAQIPDHAGLLAMRGELALRRRDWNAALRHWAAVRSLAPARADAVTKTVFVMRQLELFEQADDLLRQALVQFPRDPDVLSSSAQLAVTARDWPEAEQRWRTVLEASPNSVQACIGLAAALARQDRPRDGDDVLRDAVARLPLDERLMTEYARSAARMFSWAEASMRWQLVYENCPPRASTYLEYTVALEKAEEFLRAEVIASEGVGFAPHDLALLSRHANLALQRIDYKEATSRWEAIVQQFPDEPSALEGLEAVKDAIELAKKMKAMDKSLPARVGMRGSLYVPDKNVSNDRVPQVGPTAVDLLLTGAPLGDMASPEQAAEPSTLDVLRDKMRRVFGRK